MFRSVIMKLTAFCNLNCSYSYMFNQADRTYSRIPKHLPLATALLCLDRVQEHLSSHGERSFNVTLHGGEPTLWPLASFRQLLRRAEAIRAAGLDLRVSMQTNAVRIPPGLLELLAEHDVPLGISIDGPQSYNDSTRVTHGGGGSYDQVALPYVAASRQAASA